jgi:hypothetical protein
MYHDLMIDNIDAVTDVRLKALKKIEKQGSGCQGIQQESQSKSFQVGQLVWKTILPIGSKSIQFSGHQIGEVLTK